MKPTDVAFRCRCRRWEMVAHDVSPAVANRVICHCAGCRAFAGRMDPTILDENEGTHRLQVDPSSLEVTRGQDLVRGYQQTPKGAFRWATACCRSTIGLTLRTARVPFVGLDLARLDEETLGDPLDDVLGPLRARVNRSFPREQRRELRADAASVVAMLAHLAPLTWRWWRQGAHRRSPFFDGQTGEPVVDIERLYTQAPALLSTAGCR